jgi:hypothetical protein
MNEHELDAEFERIVAGWDDEAPDPERRATPGAASTEAPEHSPDRPAAGAEGPGEDLGGPRPSPAGTPGDERPAGDATASGITLPIAPGTRHVWRGPTGADPDESRTPEDDEDEGHFVPPTVTDLPSTEDDPMYWAIVVGLAGGPLLLLYLLVFDREGSGWWIATAVAMTVVGFVLLVLRGGSDRDPFDDGTRL